jgi:hypothetical protein
LGIRILALGRVISRVVHWADRGGAPPQTFGPALSYLREPQKRMSLKTFDPIFAP